MKYIIDLPEEFAEATKEYWDKTVGTRLEPYLEPDRKAIEDEVWNFVDFMIHEMDVEEREECFGESAYSIYSHKLSYNEAKSKFEAWMKQKNELHVGDEIVGIYSDGEISPPLVVLKVEGNYYYGIYSKTGEFVQGGLNYEKTGKHFDEVEELLQKMRGTE